MSRQSVNQVIQRAIGDAAFRRELQRDPSSTLAGFDLTSDERAAITSGDPTRITALGVDQRMSKAFGLGGMSDLSKTVISDDTSAGGAAFLDEGVAAGTSGLVGQDASDSGTAALIADDASGINAAVIGTTTGATASAFVTDDASGDGTAAFDAGAPTGSELGVDPANLTGDAAGTQVEDLNQGY